MILLPIAIAFYVSFFYFIYFVLKWSKTVSIFYFEMVKNCYNYQVWISELPSQLCISEVVEALLYVDNSLEMVLKVIVNSPWSVTEGW